MAKYLNMIIRWMARAHDAILTLNDSFETHFSDKQLHFLVIGAIGLGLILLIYPVFRLLARRNRVLAITWIYVFVAGMTGFFAVTAALIALHLLTWAFRGLFGLAKRRSGVRRRARA